MFRYAKRNRKKILRKKNFVKRITIFFRQTIDAKFGRFFTHIYIYFFFTESDPYPIDALPTCSHAVNVCQNDRDCKKIYDNFQRSCKVQNGQCRMDNW